MPYDQSPYRPKRDSRGSGARAEAVRVPDDPMEIEAMPELRRGVAVAYCDAPGPLEEGGVTRFAISPTPAGWSPERVASFYREYNTAMMANLTVHEAMPGHMVQLAHARRYRGATRVRQDTSGSQVVRWPRNGVAAATRGPGKL